MSLYISVKLENTEWIVPTSRIEYVWGQGNKVLIGMKDPYLDVQVTKIHWKTTPPELIDPAIQRWKEKNIEELDRKMLIHERDGNEFPHLREGLDQRLVVCVQEQIAILTMKPYEVFVRLIG